MKNKGQYLELLVQAIERSIDPETSIEWDVNLPVLNSQEGHTRQCDIVLRKGPKHRQTVSIVEVQDRKSPVKINEFLGWLKKLEQVGAQHLICVSRRQFPKSIVEQAKYEGNRVLLVQLEDAKPKEMPLDFVSISFRFRLFKLLDIDNATIGYDKSALKTIGITNLEEVERDLTPTEKVFTIDKTNMLSMYDIARDWVTPSNIEKSTTQIQLPPKGHDFFVKVKNSLIPCSLKAQVAFMDSIQETPVRTLSYTQREHGTLAWVANTHIETEDGPFELNLPITKEDGKYVARGMNLMAPVGTLLDIELTAK